MVARNSTEMKGGEVKFGKIDIKKGYDSTFSEKRHAETARPTGERIAPARAPQKGFDENCEPTLDRNR